jgi:hypothetical protein
MFKQFLLNRNPNYKPKTLERYIDDIKILERKFGKLDNDDLIKMLKANYKPNTTKAKLTSLSLYMTFIGNKKLSKKYIEEVSRLNKLSFEERKKQKKNEKQNKSWVEYPKLVKILKNRVKKCKEIVYEHKKTEEEITANKKKYIQRTLILALYVLFPPRRNEYGEMEIIDINDYNNLTTEEKYANYLVYDETTNKTYFHFGDYKTDGTFGQQLFIVPTKLANYIWFCQKLIQNEKSTEKYLLIKLNKKSFGDILTKNGVSQQLALIGREEKIGKLGVEMLRHIYITYIRKDDMKLKPKIKLSRVMAHSLKEQELYRLY